MSKALLVSKMRVKVTPYDDSDNLQPELAFNLQVTDFSPTRTLETVSFMNSESNAEEEWAPLYNVTEGDIEGIVTTTTLLGAVLDINLILTNQMTGFLPAQLEWFFSKKVDAAGFKWKVIFTQCKLPWKIKDVGKFSAHFKAFGAPVVFGTATQTISGLSGG